MRGPSSCEMETSSTEQWEASMQSFHLPKGGVSDLGLVGGTRRRAGGFSQHNLETQWAKDGGEILQPGHLILNFKCVFPLLIVFIQAGLWSCVREGK